MKLSYEVIARDKQGKIVARLRSEAKSWLKQWSQLIYGGMSGVAQTVTDTGGTGRSQSVTYDLLGVAALVGDATRGVVVGIGTTPVTINDYRLESQIAHGLGAGQLDHQATQIIYPPVVSGSECYFQIKRIFVNGSGGGISVNEIAIYGGITSTYEACIARDVLVGTVDIPDGGSITVIYSVKAVA
jgi:hypothetical protein